MHDEQTGEEKRGRGMKHVVVRFGKGGEVGRFSLFDDIPTLFFFVEELLSPSTLSCQEREREIRR